MTVHPLVAKFETGEVPPHLKSAAARGALPLPPEDLVQILFHLRKDPSKEIQADIVKTIESLPEDPLIDVAANPATSGAMLDFLGRAAFRRESVLDKVLVNPSTADATLALFAEHGAASALDLLVLNQVRLTRCPAIIQAMLRNPRLAADNRRRLKEIWDLHQGEVATAKAGERAPAEVAAAPAPVEPGESPAEQDLAAEEDPSETVMLPAPAPAAEGSAPADDEPLDLADLASIGSTELDERILEAMAEDDATEEELRLAQRLLTMSVPDKVQLAMKGNREARMVLIRDASKQVQEAVIDSPKITENEIEKIANMRSVSDDVLRMIGNNREATKNYSICLGLVRNPKTPQPISMQLMQRLQNRDLTQLGKDKNVPDIIRRHAHLTLEKRQPKKAPGGKK